MTHRADPPCSTDVAICLRPASRSHRARLSRAACCAWLAALCVPVFTPRASADPPPPASGRRPPVASTGPAGSSGVHRAGTLAPNAHGLSRFTLESYNGDGGSYLRLVLVRAGGDCTFALDHFDRSPPASHVRWIRFSGATAAACAGRFERVQGTLRIDRPDAPGEIILMGTAGTTTIAIQRDVAP